MKVIILEDETPAFNKLSKYLLEYNPKVEIIAWYRSVEEALQEQELFNHCDLLISDIKLLDGNSFTVFQQLKIYCPIIFCTAYNKYMQDAFKTNGISYLVKPYSQVAFNEAMQKYDRFFHKKSTTPINKDTLASIEQILEKNIKAYKQRFSVKKRDGIIIKSTSDILYFQASGDFCTFVDNKGEKHSINYKISDLEHLLNPKVFFRINRSEIINIEAIKKVEPFFKNKMKIRLHNNENTFTTSGARTPMFRQWLNGE